MYQFFVLYNKESSLEEDAEREKRNMSPGKIGRLSKFHEKYSPRQETSGKATSQTVELKKKRSKPEQRSKSRTNTGNISGDFLPVIENDPMAIFRESVNSQRIVSVSKRDTLKNRDSIRDVIASHKNKKRSKDKSPTMNLNLVESTPGPAPIAMNPSLQHLDCSGVSPKNPSLLLTKSGRRITKVSHKPDQQMVGAF